MEKIGMEFGEGTALYKGGESSSLEETTHAKEIPKKAKIIQ